MASTKLMKAPMLTTTPTSASAGVRWASPPSGAVSPMATCLHLSAAAEAAAPQPARGAHRPSSPTGSDPMAQPWLDSGFPTSITMAKSGRITGRKTATCPSENENGSSRGSSPKASAQRFLTTHAAVYNTFYTARHLTTRQTTPAPARSNAPVSPASADYAQITWTSISSTGGARSRSRKPSRAWRR